MFQTKIEEVGKFSGTGSLTVPPLAQEGWSSVHQSY
jgi:hypothetical protein